MKMRLLFSIMVVLCCRPLMGNVADDDIEGSKKSQNKHVVAKKIKRNIDEEWLFNQKGFSEFLVRLKKRYVASKPKLDNYKDNPKLQKFIEDYYSLDTPPLHKFITTASKKYKNKGKQYSFLIGAVMGWYAYFDGSTGHIIAQYAIVEGYSYGGDEAGKAENAKIAKWEKRKD